MSNALKLPLRFSELSVEDAAVLINEFHRNGSLNLFSSQHYFDADYNLTGENCYYTNKYEDFGISIGKSGPMPAEMLNKVQELLDTGLYITYFMSQKLTPKSEDVNPEIHLNVQIRAASAREIAAAKTNAKRISI